MMLNIHKWNSSASINIYSTQSYVYEFFYRHANAHYKSPIGGLHTDRPFVGRAERTDHNDRRMGQGYKRELAQQYRR